MDWLAELERYMHTVGYVSLTRATELTGHTESSLYGMIHRGRLPSEKRRGRVFLPEEGLRELVGADVYDAQHPEAKARINEALRHRAAVSR